MFSCRAMGICIKRSMYVGVAVPTVRYETEAWSMAVVEKKRLNVIEMRFLGSMLVEQSRMF